MDLNPINLEYKSLVGLSEKQISEHYEILYKGYVKKTAEIREKLENVSSEGINGTFHEERELKLEESFALNAVKLHEEYFKGLGGKGESSEYVVAAIKKDFGSFEGWENQFKSLGLAARGWVVLYYDLDSKKLQNGICDWHSHGGIWSAFPIMVLDVYEHAYFIDYGTNRKDYIEAYSRNINWDYVEKRLQEAERIKNGA